MRRFLAVSLCATSKVFVMTMAVLSGLGVTIALIILAATGALSVGAVVILFIFVLPALFVIYWLTTGLAVLMLYTAKLLDDEATELWGMEQRDFLDAARYGGRYYTADDEENESDEGGTEEVEMDPGREVVTRPVLTDKSRTPCTNS
jgi:Zn-dependent protease with chaperone function